MRIIKLSPSDPHMKSRPMVDEFFSQTLKKRNPEGQFFITQGRIAERGLSVGERLLFTYEGDCIYEARAASGRVKTALSGSWACSPPVPPELGARGFLTLP